VNTSWNGFAKSPSYPGKSGKASVPGKGKSKLGKFRFVSLKRLIHPAILPNLPSYSPFL